jgi:hypothetical protein
MFAKARIIALLAAVALVLLVVDALPVKLERRDASARTGNAAGNSTQAGTNGSQTAGTPAKETEFSFKGGLKTLCKMDRGHLLMSVKSKNDWLSPEQCLRNVGKTDYLYFAKNGTLYLVNDASGDVKWKSTVNPDMAAAIKKANGNLHCRIQLGDSNFVW